MKNKFYYAMLLCALASGTANASIDTLDGEFLTTTQTDFYTFTVDTAGDVNLYTSSSAPFDPTLTLWSATSPAQDPAAWTQLGFNDNTSSLSFFESGVNAKDAQIKLTLDAGTYFTNVSSNASLFAYQFNVDTNNVAGTGALVSNVSVSSVPLPAAVWMFATGMISFFGFSKRKAQRRAI
jgi:hypothetical protein